MLQILKTKMQKMLISVGPHPTAAALYPETGNVGMRVGLIT